MRKDSYMLQYKNTFSGQPEKIADLVGSGGKFFFSQPKKTKPVGEFEVQKSLGTISGLRCPELEAPPATKMVCTNQERAENSISNCLPKTETKTDDRSTWARTESIHFDSRKFESRKGIKNHKKIFFDL